MKPRYKPEKNYAEHAPAAKQAHEKPPESTPEQRLSPSGTVRGYDSKSSEKAKQRALRDIGDMLK